MGLAEPTHPEEIPAGTNLLVSKYSDFSTS